MASFNTRVQLKNDTSTNWAKATTFTPLAGEVLIYDAGTTTPKLKVGDGTTLATSLPFIGNEKVDKVDGKALSTNDFTDAYKTKLDGIAANANNYTYTLPSATSSTLGGVKVGSNITVSSGVISLTKSNVTSALGYTPPTTNTTYSAATTSTAGLMSATDKAKLDDIAEGANNYTYTLPTAGSSLGGVKTTSTVTSNSGYTACPIISGVVYYKDTDTNTDTKVTNTLATTTKAYITGTTSSTTNTGTQVFDTGVYLDTTAGQLVATTFKGNLSGNASSATTATSATKATQDASGNTITSTYETKSDASAKLTSAKAYADQVKSDLLNGAGAAYDTLKELGDLIDDNADAIDVLETVAASKVAIADYDIHTHTVAHTPAGSVGSSSVTPAGSVSSSFTGAAATSGAPSATATVASSTHTHTYTPSGTVSKPTFTGSAVTSGTPSGTTSVYSITGVGSVATLTATVSNRCLTFTFGGGSVPTRSSVTLPSTSHTHSVTASGSVSQPTFTGTEASTTAITGTTSVAGGAHTHSVTAKGSVSSSFTGTAASHSHTFTGTAATLTTSVPVVDEE